MVKKILLAVLVFFILIQFFPIDMVNPVSDEANDFIALENPPENVEVILRQACYDCHSHSTKYPWYAHVAPVSWWLKDHIDEGREHLNLTRWAEYDAERRDHKLEEMIEEVEEGEMPLSSYTWIHTESRLSEEQRKELTDWIKEIR